MAAPPPSSPPNDPTTPTTTSNNHTPTANSTTPTTNSAPRKAKSRSMLVPRHSPHRAREAHARRARGALRSSGGASPSTTTTTTTTASGNKPSALSVSLSASSMRHRGASPSHRPYLGRSGTVGVPGATARKTHKKHPSGSNSATLRLRSTFHPEPSPIAFLTRNSPGGHSFSTSSLLRSVDSEQSYEGEDDEGAPRVTGTGEWDLSRHRAVSQPVRSATLPSGQLSIPDLADTLQLDRRTSVADLIVQADDDRSRGRARVGSPLHRSGSRPGSAPGEDEPNPLGHVRESSREDVMYEPSISQNTSMETSVDGGGEFLSSDEDTDDDEPIVADPRANQTPSPTAAVGGGSAFTAVSPGPDATPTSPMLGHHRRVSVKVTPLGKQRALSADRVASPRKELFPDAAPADADAVPKSGSAEELALAAAFSTILGSTVKAELEDVAGAADTPKRTTTRRAAVPMFTGRNRGRSRSLIFHDRPSPYEKVQDAEDPAVVQAQLRAEERAAYEKAYQLALNKLLEAVQPPPVFPLGQLRTVKVGMLLKKDNTRNSWRSRIFALEGPYLYYYAHRRDPEPRGVLCLNSCVVKHEKTISQQRGVNCFSLTAYRGWNLKRERDYKLRSYFFASDSYADMSEWMSILSLTGAWYSLPSREPPARVRRAYFARRSMFLASSNVSS